MFSDVLKVLRTEKQLSQADLAKLLQVSPGTVGLWEQGRRVPNDVTLVKLARLFRVTIDRLLDVEEEFAQSHTISDEEIKLVTEFRQLSEKSKTIVLGIIYHQQQLDK